MPSGAFAVALSTTKSAIHKTYAFPIMEHFLLFYLGNLRPLQAKTPHQAFLIEEERVDLRL